MRLFPHPPRDGVLPAKPCLRCGIAADGRNHITIPLATPEPPANMARLVGAWIPLCAPCMEKAAAKPQELIPALEILAAISQRAGNDAFSEVILKGLLVERGIIVVFVDPPTSAAADAPGPSSTPTA